MKKAWWGLMVVILILVFRNLLVGDLAWGDAPHFYSSEFGELLSEPSAWVSRGNNLGGVNKFVWIWPLMVVYGLFGKIGLNNNQILLALFYLPSIGLSLMGMVFLMRHWKFDRRGQMFAALVYLLNTYYLLIVDGGVVGLVLAYGIFPLALYTLFRLAKSPVYWNFVWALVANQGLIIADPRVGALVWVTFGFLEGVSYLLRKERNRIRPVLLPFVLLVLVLLGLNAYWILPLVKLWGVDMASEAGGVIELRDALSLYLPHWPGNIFGKTRALPVMFIGLPSLVLMSTVFRRGRVVLVLFVAYLFFAVLVAGYAPVKNVPFGSAFRDSSKFFIPLVMMAGMMIGALVEKINFSWFGLVVVGYLVLLVVPVVKGEMNFSLSTRAHSGDYGGIANTIREDDGFFRTAWFPERHPMAFQTEERPALDARSLVSLRSLARLNVGEDRFNFLNWAYDPWFDLLGIRYLVFADDVRVIEKSEGERAHWEKLLSLFGERDGLIYENKGTYPRIFGAEKIVAVVGSDDVYDGVEGLPVPMVFFEDGKFEPTLLSGLPKDSVKILFNKKEKRDLAMSFLQEYFIALSGAVENEWAVYGEDEYLKYKYQLLMKEVEHSEFDYGEGLSFSSEGGEKIRFRFDLGEGGGYVLGIRFYQKEDAAPMSVRFDGEESVAGSDKYSWYIKEVSLASGKIDLEIENTSGLSVVNVVALVPQEEWVQAQKQAEVYLAHFGVVTSDEVGVFEKVEVDSGMKSPFWYELEFPRKVSWVVMTDSYHPMWKLKRDQLEYLALPGYSMINIFYKRPEWDSKVKLYFTGQYELRWGIYWTVLTALGTGIGLLWFYPKKNET